MMTFWDASLNLRANLGGTEGATWAERARATVAWVEASCEAEGMLRANIAHVIERVKREILAGDFPLIELALRDEPDPANTGLYLVNPGDGIVSGSNLAALTLPTTE